MNAETQTIWITKYALTMGVYPIQAKVTGGFAKQEQSHFPRFVYWGVGDFHTTREAAIAKAEQMRLRKIESLKKHLAKLEKGILVLESAP